MKRINNIFDKIISVENLTEADRMARKGKKKSFGVINHDKNKEANILKLHESLKNGTYKTSEYNIFKVHDPKERDIYQLPYYPDRIVHWAIMLQLEPIWMRVFTSDSYSCIKGRGIHGAARAVVKALRDVDGTKYCLKLDVRKFYPSISQNIMMDIINKKIKCKRTISLLSEIIYSTDAGLPIGNYISQYAANLYLTYFDHWLKEDLKVKYYFRYCDDLVFLSDSKEYLWELLSSIRKYLDNKLNLVIKDNYQVFPVVNRGIDFVGYKFYHTHVLVRKNIKKNLFRKQARIKRLGLSDKETKIQMASYWGWISQSFVSSGHLIKKLNAA